MWLFLVVIVFVLNVLVCVNVIVDDFINDWEKPWDVDVSEDNLDFPFASLPDDVILTALSFIYKLTTFIPYWRAHNIITDIWIPIPLNINTLSGSLFILKSKAIKTASNIDK